MLEHQESKRSVCENVTANSYRCVCETYSSVNIKLIPIIFPLAFGKLLYLLAGLGMARGQGQK